MMKSDKQLFEELKQEYSIEEIADFAMIPNELGEKEQKLAQEEFVAMRLKKRETISDQDRLLSGLLSLKYQIKAYIRKNSFDVSISFGKTLSQYLSIIGRKQKEFAKDINIHPSRLSRILKGKEKIGKKVAYRLERHSGDLIPALYWWKLMQKEVEQEMLSDTQIKQEEQKQVSYIAYKRSRQ